MTSKHLATTCGSFKCFSSKYGIETRRFAKCEDTHLAAVGSYDGHTQEFPKVTVSAQLERETDSLLHVTD